MLPAGLVGGGLKQISKLIWAGTSKLPFPFSVFRRRLEIGKKPDKITKLFRNND
jgi:hypothetical protein